MVAPTFPISYGPVFPVELEVEPRLSVSTYGDGYEQVSGDGINIIKPSTEVVWEGLTKAELDLGYDFLVGLAGANPFMWKFPGDATATKWTCRKWRKRFIGVNNWGLNCTFIRSFNPS